jgi:hypothetical protein
MQVTVVAGPGFNDLLLASEDLPEKEKMTSADAVEPAKPRRILVLSI